MSRSYGEVFVESKVCQMDQVAVLNSNICPVEMQTDEELWDAFVKTDSFPAFDKIYRRHKGRLVGYFTSKNKGCVLMDADGLANEVFTQAIKNKTAFDPNRGTFASWLYGIARHTNSGIFRKLGPWLGPQTDEIDPILLVACTEDLESKMDVRKCINRLPKGQQDVICLGYFAELTEREIATVLGIPEGTVSSRKHGALRKLRRMMADSRQG